MRHVLIFGATSAIAQAIARRLAAQGAAMLLVARDADRLAAVADDLRVRGAAKVEIEVMDALDYERHASLVGIARERLGGLDVAIIAHGTLPDQKACEQSFEFSLREIEINALSVISLLTHLANHLESEQRGIIVVISSVAGDRGRQSNYIYGSAKGMVTTFMQGLRNRLHASGVQVLTVKPGFVDTPMTTDFKKGALWASADKVAEGIVRAINRRRDVVYLPWFWRWIMYIIRAIPEPLFKRLKL